MHLAACLALVRPVTMTDQAAMEWIKVAAKELTSYPPSVVEQASSAARRACSHHAKLLPFIVEECEKLEAQFYNRQRAAAAAERIAARPKRDDPPLPPPISRDEILDNERWLNTSGERQEKLRRMGLTVGALVEEGGQVRYAPDLR